MASGCRENSERRKSDIKDFWKRQQEEELKAKEAEEQAKKEKEAAEKAEKEAKKKASGFEH